MRAISAMALLICLSPAALASNVITGLVRNQSRGQPAVGDEVILVRLDRGMQEEARARTDAHGTFALNLQHPDRPYLIRIVHQNVIYDQQVSANGLAIQVFDASPHVPAVTGTIEILRAGTNGRLLHVSDMYEIKNASSPPLTLVGEHTFEVHLPAKAKIDSVLAASPGNTSVMISATDQPGEPGDYTVDFPLRPGATKFAFNYDLPYDDGHAVFQTRHFYPLQQFAVMIPPTMKFSSRSPGFEILATGNSNYQVRAAGQLKSGKGPAFEISGTGALPRIRDQQETQARSQGSVSPHPTVSGADRTALPARALLSENHSSPQSLVWAGASCAFLTACALIVWRMRKTRMGDQAKPESAGSAAGGTGTPFPPRSSRDVSERGESGAQRFRGGARRA